MHASILFQSENISNNNNNHYSNFNLLKTRKNMFIFLLCLLYLFIL